ncbi:MAG TPA: hypothetical protein VFW11_16905 [Cyclobacteriaceae bacterium]|nr:hypothetical protein [Cyclobacteriaceae bacterium]
MRLISKLFLTLTVIAACESAPEDLFVRHFTIKKGEHYSTPRLVEMLQTNRLVFEATFDSSAVYEFDDAGFQDSKNKLLGFSDCNSLHHDNSARFAWQWYNDQLEIYAYCYVNGERVEEFIGTAEINEKKLFEIELTDDSYIFKFSHYEPVTIKRGSACNRGAYYMLWPYFGGSLAAPHDVQIDISIKR